VKLSQVNQEKLDEIVRRMDKKLTRSIRELERKQSSGLEERRLSARRFRQAPLNQDLAGAFGLHPQDQEDDYDMMHNEPNDFLQNLSLFSKSREQKLQVLCSGPSVRSRSSFKQTPRQLIDKKLTNNSPKIKVRKATRE
jgi:hypothetical protein